MLALTGFFTQFILSLLHHLKYKSEKNQNQEFIKKLLEEKSFPSISVIYPIYNEEPEILEMVMESASKCLEIPNLELIFVDDGSTNLAKLMPIYKKYSKHKNNFRVFCEENKGKREAQYFGFNKCNGEFIITVDSDTIINPEGIFNLVAPIIKDPKIGAVTGDVRVENRNANFLTNLIAIRYWLAFNLERAAQSYSGSMLCCSGPFSVYRKEII
jgi:hyaluronan synthase